MARKSCMPTTPIPPANALRNEARARQRPWAETDYEAELGAFLGVDISLAWRKPIDDELTALLMELFKVLPLTGGEGWTHEQLLAWHPRALEVAEQGTVLLRVQDGRLFANG